MKKYLLLLLLVITLPFISACDSLFAKDLKMSEEEMVVFLSNVEAPEDKQIYLKINLEADFTMDNPFLGSQKTYIKVDTKTYINYTSNEDLLLYNSSKGKIDIAGFKADLNIMIYTLTDKIYLSSEVTGKQGNTEVTTKTSEYMMFEEPIDVEDSFGFLEDLDLGEYLPNFDLSEEGLEEFIEELEFLLEFVTIYETMGGHKIVFRIDNKNIDKLKEKVEEDFIESVKAGSFVEIEIQLKDNKLKKISLDLRINIEEEGSKGFIKATISVEVGRKPVGIPSEGSFSEFKETEEFDLGIFGNLFK